MSADLDTSARTCCKDAASCTQLNTKEYNCSSNYTDKTYAQMFCPFNTKACGQKKDIEFSGEGEKLTINITNLTKGETCFYSVRAKCGAPAFKLNQNVSGVEIQYLQIQDNNYVNMN